MVSSRGRASADKRAITNSNRFSIMPANPRIYFDIETGPLPIAELVIPPFDPSQVKLGNIKNPDIIAEKIQRAEENHVSDYIKHAALDALSGQVLCIGYRVEHEQPAVLCADADGEKAMLLQFWELEAPGDGAVLAQEWQVLE